MGADSKSAVLLCSFPRQRATKTGRERRGSCTIAFIKIAFNRGSDRVSLRRDVCSIITTVGVGSRISGSRAKQDYTGPSGRIRRSCSRTGSAQICKPWTRTWEIFVRCVFLWLFSCRTPRSRERSMICQNVLNQRQLYLDGIVRIGAPCNI